MVCQSAIQPPLTYTFTPNNLNSVQHQTHCIMDNSFKMNLMPAVSMDLSLSKKFTIIFNSHFHTTPLGFVENPGSTALRLIHHHLKEDRFGNSMTAGWILLMIQQNFYTGFRSCQSLWVLLYIIIFFYNLPCTTHLYTSTLHVIVMASFKLSAL